VWEREDCSGVNPLSPSQEWVKALPVATRNMLPRSEGRKSNETVITIRNRYYHEER